MSQENVELLRGVYEQWAAGRFFATPEVFDPSVEVNWVAKNPDMTPASGVEAMARTWMDWLRSWDDVTMEAERFVAVGERVVVLVTLRGRGKASGLELEAEQAHVWTLADGRAIRIDAYEDAAEALAAVGSVE